MIFFSGKLHWSLCATDQVAHKTQDHFHLADGHKMPEINLQLVLFVDLAAPNNLNNTATLRI